MEELNEEHDFVFIAANPALAVAIEPLIISAILSSEFRIRLRYRCLKIDLANILENISSAFSNLSPGKWMLNFLKQLMQAFSMPLQLILVFTFKWYLELVFQEVLVRIPVFAMFAWICTRPYFFERLAYI